MPESGVLEIEQQGERAPTASVTPAPGRRATEKALRESEENLRESERRYRNLFERLPVGLYRSSEGGQILDVNPALVRMLGYPDRESLLATNALELYVDPEDRKEWLELLEQSGVVLGSEKRFRRRDGTIIWVRETARAVHDGDGRVPYYEGSIEDVTRSKKAEESVTRQRILLEAVNKVLLETLRCETDEEVARTCLAVAEELTGSKFGFIGEVNQAGRFDSIAISDPGWNTCRMPRTDAVRMLRDMEIRGIWGGVIKGGQSKVINAPSSHPDRVGTPEGHPPVTAFLGVPLKRAGETVGMIGLANKESGYGLTDQEAIETLSIAFVEALNRKRAEEALRESEERFRTVADFTYDWEYWIGADGSYIYISPACERITGYHPGEFQRDPGLLEAIAHPEDRAAVARHIHETLESSEVCSIDFRIITRSGEERWIGHVCQPVYDARGKRRGRRASNRDITDRKQTERLLQALKGASSVMGQAMTPDEVIAAGAEEFKRLGFSCAVFLVDESRSNVALVCTTYDAKLVRLAERLTGLTSKGFRCPIADSNMCAKIISDRKTLFLKNPEEAVRGVLPGLLDELAGQVAKILKMPATIVTPLMVESEAIGMLSVQSNSLTERDLPAITTFAHQMAVAWHKTKLLQDLKGSLEELKRTQAQLVQPHKMESVGRLAGGIAHDFNNLLTVINGYAEFLEKDLSPSDPNLESVTRIREAGLRGADLVRQLLAFSRRQIVQRRVLNLSKVVHGLETMLRRIIGEDIEVEFILEPHLWPVKVDPTQFEQVVVNLAANARDAMPRGGKLTIETSNAVLDDEYVTQHLGARPGDFAVLAISDTGVGMSQEVREHIFEPFFTTKELGKGTGLGLATVYGITKQNEGYIWCCSEEGIGTTFEIYLPRVAEAVEPAGQKMPRDVSTGTETILVVEDDRPVRNLAVRVLEGAGYTVLAAEGVEDAVEQVERHCGSLDLLLTDVVMPDGSGAELADRIAQIHPDTRVVYMSGYT
ncbi:MAG: PAS domain S-box protein, partial [Anaerolineae bacterium]|nr:PAS domain S-box protein [Anaerolineae bacterium]